MDGFTGFKRVRGWVGLGSSGGAGVPAVGEPGVVAELADDDDCVGQGVDDFDAAFGAVGEFLESVVVSGVGLFNWSAFSGLQWGPAWADHATAVDLFQEGSGGSGVVAGIRMDCDRFG